MYEREKVKYQESTMLARWMRDTLKLEKKFTIDDLIELVERLNGKVKKVVDFGIGSEIEKTEDKQGFIIRISVFNPDNINILHIANALGNIIVNLRFAISEEIWFNYELEDLCESTEYKKRKILDKRARVFAHELLMPEDEYDRIIDEYKEGTTVNLNKMADYFNVTVPSIERRGKFLEVFAKENCWF